MSPFSRSDSKRPEQAPETFAAILDRHGARVHRMARRHVQNESEAEDLTQEIFIDLYRGLAGFRGDCQMTTWVYRIALNHCLRRREKLRKRADINGESYDEELHTVADSRHDPARNLAQSELSEEVHCALDGLSPLHREVVVLHEMHGLTYSQCAAVLDVPIGTVKSRLSNAFRALRQSLRGYVLQGHDSKTEPTTLGETI